MRIKSFFTILINLIYGYRWQKNAPKYPYSLPPTIEEDFLKMNDLPGLVWTYASVFDFWSVSLAAVETVETPSEKLGWILNNTNSIWYNALFSIALNLIRQYAIMSVDFTRFPDVFRLSLRDVLHAVPTFKDSFEELTLERKCMLLIADIGMDLARISLEIHEYDLDSDVVLPPTPDSTISSPPGTPLPSARACAAYVDVATKTEAICKQAANEEENAILEQRAKETVELLRHVEFAPRQFKLDRQRAPLMAPEVVDAVGLKYGRLFFRAKTKFHAEQVKVEIARLKMLTSQSYCCINEIESELKYIKSLEKARAKEASILKALRKQQRDIRHDFRDRSGALDEPVMVDDSDEDAIAEWVTTNPEIVPPVEPAGNKQTSGPGVAANQAGFTAMAQHTASRVGGADAGNSAGSDLDNGVGSDAKNGVGSGLEVDARGNLGEGVVFLSTQPATAATGLASSRFTSAAPTSPLASRGHLAPMSSVGRAIKPPVLLSRAQSFSHAVSVPLAVRPFEDT